MYRALLILLIAVIAACSGKTETEPAPVVKKAALCPPLQETERCAISLVTLLTDPESLDGSTIEVAGFVSEREDAIYLDRDSMEYGIVQNGIGLSGLSATPASHTPFLQLVGVFHLNPHFGVQALDNGPDARFRGSIAVDRTASKISYDPYQCINGSGGPPKGTIRKVLGEELCINIPNPPSP